MKHSMDPVVVTADARQVVMYSVSRTESGRPHLEVARRMVCRESPTEHHRPSALGRGPSANAAQHFADESGVDAEDRRRFAREVADWLRDLVRAESSPRVELFAAPRFLGSLRAELSSAPNRITLHEGELTRLDAGELAEHPAVKAVLRPHVARTT